MMSTNEELKYQAIFSIDNYNHRYYQYRNGALHVAEKLQFKRQNYYSAFIANKDLIIAPVVVSRSIPDEDLMGTLEDKAYEELGLDPAVEYLIHYREVPGEGDGRKFQLFVLEQLRYEEIFEDLRTDLKYLDFVVPAPLLYQTLYTENLLERAKIHCFLYFTHYDTTLTFYKDGEYLYSKSINYSLQQLYDRYCEIAGKTVDEKQFFRIFQKEGVKTTHLEYQQNLIRLFNEIFITINDIVIYTKRAYNVDVIDQMFIGSELGPISGADEYAQNYLGLYSSAMIFDFKIKSEEWYVDQMHYMLVRSTERYWSDPESLINFTQNPRPPVFFKRASGQFILSLVAALLIASAYPLYYLVAAYMLDVRNYQLKQEEQTLGKEVAKYKSILGRKRKEIEALDHRILMLRKAYNAKEKTLRSVYDKKVNYRLKSNQLAAFADDLDQNNLHVDRIESRGDNYAISIIAKSDRNITQLIREITNKYAKEIRMIDIRKIASDENSSFYHGILKVELR